MKTIKKDLLFTALLLSVALSLSAAEGPEASAKMHITIPFGGEGYMPELVLEDDEDEEKSLHLAFDSGSTYEALYRSAIRKFAPDVQDSLVQVAVQQCMKLYPDAGQEELGQKIQSYIDTGSPNLDVWLKMGGIELVDGLRIESVDFKYDALSPTRDAEDGIVGLGFFGDCERLTIDYAGRVMELNGEPLHGAEGPLVRLEGFGVYKTEIVVDGIRQDAIIDTGAEKFIECDRAALSMDDGEKLDFILNGTLKKKTAHRWRTARVSFAGREWKVAAFKSSDRKAKVSDSGRRAGHVYSLFGYAFFEGRRIQFDFKNGKFIVE